MTKFDKFIDLIKDTYYTLVENRKSLLKPAVIIVISRIIQFALLVTAIITLTIHFASENAKPIYGTAIMLIIFIVIMAVAQTIVSITESYSAIAMCENEEITFPDIWKYISYFFFKIFLGSIVIFIVLFFILLIASTLMLIVLIPIAILTFGIGTVIISKYIHSSFSYWKLICINDDMSPYDALMSNVNLGKTNIMYITIFTLLLSSLVTVISSILGVLGIPIAIVAGIIWKIILNIFVIKVMEN